MANGVRAGKAYIELSTDNTALMRGLSRAQSTLNRWGGSLSKLGAKITGAVSLGAVPALLSTKVFADFDDAMRDVRAVTGATQEQFESLTATAEKLGRETSFSAKQVAEGMGALGRMGFTPDQIEAAIPAVMDLSRATGTDLAAAAEIAANNMNIFGLSADQMTSVADILTATANGSAQTLTDLAEGLKMAGPQGAAAGENIRTVAASLGILANMGLKGSMAGNALKKAYSQFAKTKIQDKLAQVGIRTTDENGDLRSMPDIMAEIGAAMSRMPSAEKLAFAEEIFDMRGALAGLNLGARTEDLREFLDMLNNSGGTAHTQAVEKDTGIGGTFRRMQSAIEGVAISFGRIISEAIQPYIEWLARASTSLADWMGQHKDAIRTMLLVGASIGAVGVTLLVLGKTFAVVSAALGVLHTVLAGAGAAFGFFKSIVVGANVAMLATSPVGLLAAGLAALGALAVWVGGLFEGLGSSLSGAMSGGMGAMREAFDALKTTFKAGDLASSWQVALAGVKLVFAEFMQGLAPWWDKFCFAMQEKWSNMGDGILKAWYAVKGTVLAIFYALMSSVNNVMAKVKKAWNWIKAYTPGSGYTVEDARRDNAEIEKQSARTAERYETAAGEAWNSIGENSAMTDSMTSDRTINDSRNAWAQMADEARQAMQSAVAKATSEEAVKTAAGEGKAQPTAPKPRPTLPGELESLSANKAAGSFNARAFAGGGMADWSIVKGIRDIAKQIEKNTENDQEEEVFA